MPKKLTLAQKKLMRAVIENLNRLETHSDVHYVLIKNRYFQICRMTHEIDEMVSAGLPIMPKSLFTFSLNRTYPVQNKFISMEQYQRLQAFAKAWQTLNQITER